MGFEIEGFSRFGFVVSRFGVFEVQGFRLFKVWGFVLWVLRFEVGGLGLGVSVSGYARFWVSGFEIQGWGFEV